jgi:hypothetical protein
MEPSESRFGLSFVCRITGAGELQWTQSWTSEANAVAVDASGDVYVTGGFGAGSDFDPGSGELIPPHPGDRSKVVFLSKFDAEGQFQWVSVGRQRFSFGFDIATDEHGNVYVAGRTNGDAFLAKLAPD